MFVRVMLKSYYPLTQYVSISKTSEEQDFSLPTDGFEATVSMEGELKLRYNGVRAREYFYRFIKSVEKDGRVPAMYASDYPAFPLRGVVEGFYGKPFSFEARMGLMPVLRELKMNAYIYAPKDDRYHRDLWREPYPEADIAAIGALFRAAEQNSVDFFFAISPGKDFCFTDEADYAALLAKLRAVQALGITRFALLMDDIEPKLSEQDAAVFASAAEAHAHLAGVILSEIQPEKPFLFCPTDYMQNFDTPYRAELRKFLPPECEVFWTGYNTVAEAITEADGEAVCATFGRKPILWDNYPVNDFNPKRRVYLGAVSGRGRFLDRTHIGYIANLSELYESNMLPLFTMADYAWDSSAYDADRSLVRAVRWYFGGEEAMPFVLANADTVMREVSPKRECLMRGELEALTDFYLNLQKSASYIERSFPSLFKELKEVFLFIEKEIALFDALKGGKTEQSLAAVKVLAKEMNALKYTAADLSLLQYANEAYKLTGEEAFTVDEKRIIYRKW